MADGRPLQRVTIFLEKGAEGRPWRLSIRTLNGVGLRDRYYGCNHRTLLGPDLEMMIADVTSFIRDLVVREEVPEVYEVTATE